MAEKLADVIIIVPFSLLKTKNVWIIAYPDYWNVSTSHSKSQFGGEWNDRHADFQTCFNIFLHGLKFDFLPIHVPLLAGSISLPRHEHEEFG